MALQHPIWTYFSPYRKDIFRAVCLLCDTECEGGPRGTGGLGTGGKWWARDMIKHLQDEHTEECMAFKRMEFMRKASKADETPGDFITSFLDKEKFRQALLELKAENIKREALDNKAVKTENREQQEPACNMCTGKFKYEPLLKRHIRFIHKICEMCGFESEERSAMKLHIKTHIRRYECKLCVKVYAHLGYLNMHIATAHEGKRFSCGSCDHISTRKDSIEEHVRRVHKSNKKGCSLCKRNFSTQLLLDQHFATKHKAEKNLKCSMCSFQTAFNANLKTHQKGKHEGVLAIDKTERFSCPSCDFKSKEKGGIRSHIRVKHDNIKVECDICTSTFVSRRGMLNHKQYAHVGLRKTYICELCPYKIYRQKCGLTKHIDIEHEGQTNSFTTTTDAKIEDNQPSRFNANPRLSTIHNVRLQCNICPKTFGLAHRLERHLLYHSDERPIGCQKCSKRFREKGNLKRHMRTHLETIERPFNCPDCSKNYSEFAHLSRHRQSYHEKIKHNCNHCEKGFAEKRRLTKHMSLNHKINQYI